MLCYKQYKKPVLGAVLTFTVPFCLQAVSSQGGGRSDWQPTDGGCDVDTFVASQSVRVSCTSVSTTCRTSTAKPRSSSLKCRAAVTVKMWSSSREWGVVHWTTAKCRLRRRGTSLVPRDDRVIAAINCNNTASLRCNGTIDATTIVRNIQYSVSDKERIPDVFSCNSNMRLIITGRNVFQKVGK